MQLSAPLPFNGRELTVCQLTVRQVRQLMDGLADATPDEQLLEDLFPELLPFGVVRAAAGVTADELLAEGVTQADIDRLVEAVLKQNPGLARLSRRRRERLEQLGTTLDELTRSGPPLPSTAP